MCGHGQSSSYRASVPTVANAPEPVQPATTVKGAGRKVKARTAAQRKKSLQTV